MFSAGGHIWVWTLKPTLFYYAILFSRLIWDLVCLKGFLLWPLVGTKKVRNSPLAPDWYRESLICYYIHFIISRVVNSFWRYDNWSHTIPFAFYFVRWVTGFSILKYVLFRAHSLRALLPREPELFVYAALVLHKHKVLSS